MKLEILWKRSSALLIDAIRSSEFTNWSSSLTWTESTVFTTRTGLYQQEDLAVVSTQYVLRVNFPSETTIKQL